LTTGIQPVASFTYWGLVDFLLVAKDVLHALGDDSIAQQEAAHQIIYDGLIEPSERQNLPCSLDDRVAIEHHQMRIYAHDRPEAWQCKEWLNYGLER